MTKPDIPRENCDQVAKRTRHVVISQDAIASKGYRIIDLEKKSYVNSHRFLWKRSSPAFNAFKGGGPRLVVSTAAFHARVRGSVPGLGGLKETKMFLPHPRVKVSIVGSIRDREVACSASDRQGSNFESCVWTTVSSQSFHHPQEVLMAQFSLYVHKVRFISFQCFQGCERL